MWNPEKWYRWTYFQGRKRDADVGNRCLNRPSGSRGRPWWIGRLGLTYTHSNNIVKQLYFNWKKKRYCNIWPAIFWINSSLESQFPWCEDIQTFLKRGPRVGRHKWRNTEDSCQKPVAPQKSGELTTLGVGHPDSMNPLDDYSSGQQLGCNFVRDIKPELPS